MFDKAMRSFPVRNSRSVDFFRIELSPLANGKISASLTATTLDDEAAQLLDQEVATQPVGSIDELLTLIQANVSVGHNADATAALLLCHGGRQ